MPQLDTERYRVKPGEPVSLADRATDDCQSWEKKAAKKGLKRLLGRAQSLQERLYAEREQSLLIVFQAIDAGGKDSTTRHVLGPLNPQGVRVTGFKAPTGLELDHDFLWRIHAHAPRRGMIAVFNRSHYEDVLVARVKELAPPEIIERRYRHIQNFESLLEDAGTRVVKFMLHISKDYQAERFRRRLERPDKHWKFNPDDLGERARWDDYMEAFELALSKTSTETAPWYVIPAENRRVRDLVVAKIIVDTLEAMDPQFPPPEFNPAAWPASRIE